MDIVTRLLAPKDDILRHHILKFIFDKSYGGPNRTVYERDIAVTIKEIADQLGKTEKEVHYAAFVLTDGEAHFKDFGIGVCLVAGADTYSAYSSKKYPRQGVTHRLNRLKDYLGITTAIIAIVTSCLALFTAFRSISNNEARIRTLEFQVKARKSQLDKK